MNNAERVKLINEKLKYNKSHGIYPMDKHELSKAIYNTTQYIYRNYPITYVTVQDNSDIRKHFKKVECFLKIDLKTNEPIIHKHKSFLKKYVFECLNNFGNTTINDKTYDKYGKDAILKELLYSGYVCEILERCDINETYKYSRNYYIINLIQKI